VARAARGPRRLVVGFRAGVIPTPAIAALGELHPDLVVDVKRLEWDDPGLNLLSGNVDIAYVRQPITERALLLISLYHERRLVALRRDHPLAEADELWQRDIADERHLRYLQPLRPGRTPIRSGEEKLEHVAAGHGIIVLPLSATRHYTRPDVVYVPVVDAQLDQVFLAFVAHRESGLLEDFRRGRRSARRRHHGRRNRLTNLGTTVRGRSAEIVGRRTSGRVLRTGRHGDARASSQAIEPRLTVTMFSSRLSHDDPTSGRRICERSGRRPALAAIGVPQRRLFIPAPVDYRRFEPSCPKRSLLKASASLLRTLEF
jgi:hypothetical protein